MSTRKVKDAIDLETNEVIYLKGHAQATFMSDGRTVEDAINQAGTGGGSGGIVTETDPIFSASAAAKITDSNISAWNGKVDKVDGKQLSTEDFTTLLKQKLEGLSNYDDTEIQGAVSKLRTDLDTLVSGDTTTAIKTFNEVIAFLDGITDAQDLESIIASIEQQIATKQDKISDLETIRQGAAKGATALQSYTEKYTGTYSKPSGGIPKSDLASAVQTSLGKADTALQEHQDISGKQDKIQVVSKGTSGTTFTIEPNKFYVWGSVSSLNITLGTPSDSSVYNEYLFQFTSGSTATTLSLPSAVKWVSEPKIEANKTYQVSIVDNIGLIIGV